MSGPFILSLSLSHTHQWLWHASPAPLLPLQLHFICCRSSRVALLNDSVQPVVGVWVLLIMPVSLWGEKYRQIRPENPGAAAPYHPAWWGPHGPNQTTNSSTSKRRWWPWGLTPGALFISGPKIAFHFSLQVSLLMDFKHAEFQHVLLQFPGFRLFWSRHPPTHMKQSISLTVKSIAFVTLCDESVAQMLTISCHNRIWHIIDGCSD